MMKQQFEEINLAVYEIEELEELKKRIDDEISTRYLIFPSGVHKWGEKCWVAKVDEKTHRILEFEKDHNFKRSRNYFSKEFWLWDGVYRAFGVDSVGNGEDVYFKVEKCVVYLLS